MNRDVAKVKRLSVVLLLLGLAGCAYPSRDQARQGCDEWENKEETITYRIEQRGEQSFGNRYCREEEETKQYLGYEVTFVKEDYDKADKVFTRNPWFGIARWKVVKHFRY